MSPALLATGKPVETSAYFLERSERWKDEKPYLLDYLPAPPAVKTNAAIEQQNIDIEDIRGRENEFSFQKNGFCIVPIDCNMDPLDFDDDDHIKELYLPEIGESVKKALCATRVQIYDYTVRLLSREEIANRSISPRSVNESRIFRIALVDTTLISSLLPLLTLVRHCSRVCLLKDLTKFGHRHNAGLHGTDAKCHES